MELIYHYTSASGRRYSKTTPRRWSVPGTLGLLAGLVAIGLVVGEGIFVHPRRFALLKIRRPAG